jgi:tetratricopeptide (TPR) repeat protein
VPDSGPSGSRKWRKHMSNNFWKRVDRIIGLFPLLAIFAVLVVSANIEIKDLDLWLHIAMGKFITLHRSIPGVDVLSCSIGGRPWVNHEWLFQVIVYNLYNIWGADGLIMMQVIVVSLTMLVLLFLGYNKNRQLLTTITLLLLYMVYQQRFTIRPDLFSLFFFSVYIFVLSLHIDKKWSIPVLFIVQVLWSNTHGFFFFGPLFVFIGIFSEYVKRHLRLPYEWNDSGRLTENEYGRMKAIFLITLAACLFNPMTFKGAWYPISVLFSFSGENKIFFNHIEELQKPLTGSTLFDQSRFLYYKILIFLSLVSFVFNRRKIDISALLFWLVFLVFSLNATRNTPFFAFAAYLVIITNIIHIDYKDIVPIRFSEEKFLYLTTIIFKLLFLIWMIGYYQAISLRSYYDFDRYELKSEFRGISQKSYPNKAADFLVDNNVRGNFFNDFNSGAYLLGRTFPNIKVFIDGRTEVYGGKFFKEYQKIWEKGDVDLFEKVVGEYQITGAFLNSSRHHIPKKILNYLYSHDEWKLVYFNYDAMIFLRDVEANKSLIERFTIDLPRWQAPKIDLFRVGALRVQPYRPYYRGYTLESLGLNDVALEELEEALRVDPFYADAHDLAGKIYAQKKQLNEAFEHFRIAVTISPANKEMRHNLALSYFELGNNKGAIKQYEKIIYLWPDDPKGFFFLTKMYVTNGEYPKAMETLRQAYRLSPESTGDLTELSDMLFEKKAYMEAAKAYRLLLDSGKETAGIHKKLGRVSLATGDLKQAKYEFEKALSIAPDDEEIKNALGEL